MAAAVKQARQIALLPFTGKSFGRRTLILASRATTGFRDTRVTPALRHGELEWQNRIHTKIVTKKHMARLERERRQINLIRAIALAGIVIVVGLLAYGYLKLNVFALREPVAKVNGVTITTGEWQERVKFQRVQMLNAYNQYSFYQQNFGFDYSQQLQQITGTLNAPELLGQQVSTK